jgi:hypothetical protein
MTTNTATIVNEFVNTVGNDKEYTLKELKDILGVVYNANKATKAAAPKAAKVKPAKAANADKADAADKPKKAPSAYNIYIKHAIAKLKADEANKELSNIDCLKKAASTWKTLTKQEQEQYKNMA